MLRISIAFLVATLGGSGAWLHAESWPEFRGPTGQGIVSAGNLPFEWGPTKNVTWKLTIPGKGWSSPVVEEGRVYLTSAVAIEESQDQSLRALCLDAASGKLLWNTEVYHQGSADAPRVHGKNTHASPTPLVHAGRLYV